MDSIKNTWKNKPGIIIVSVLLVLAVIMLISVLFVRGIISRGDTELTADAPAKASIVATTPTSSTTSGEENAITPTATTKATNTVALATKAPTAIKTPKATSTKKATATPKPKLPTATLAPTDTPELEIVNLVANGGFEWGFTDEGVAKSWHKFDNGSALVLFTDEPWDKAILSGDNAQRITIVDATKPDRYAGIYQSFNVVPGEVYSLTMNGQIRSAFGDISASNYGYRMQYAIDWAGGTDWTTIPSEEWVELPWDEQLLDGDNMFFLDYSAEVVPPTEKITLFIRAWSKWGDGLESQYTLDALSLVGPKPVEAALDNPLPTTGGASASEIPMDPRVWVSAILLLFLIGGALWRKQAHRHNA